MGNTQPTNKTGRKVVAQKLEHAKKTGILSLSEHKLEEFPSAILQLGNLRTLDLSKNMIKVLPSRLSELSNLKSLNLDENKFGPGAISVVSKLSKLQNLSVGGNTLGQQVVAGPAAFPELPSGLKQLKLDSNRFSSIPPSIVAKHLTKLEKLDLSGNQLAAVPAGISNLVHLIELNLDRNSIVSLPVEVGTLKHLKQLSLRQNHISVSSTIFSDKNPQPLPANLFTDTPLIDLNLHGNPMTSTQLNQFDGYKEFLKRREKIKTTGIVGGAMTNLDVCGLE